MTWGAGMVFFQLPAFAGGTAAPAQAAVWGHDEPADLGDKLTGIRRRASGIKFPEVLLRDNS